MNAYHYTIHQCVSSILASGFLEPASAGVPHNEKLVVWFSSNEHWEPTANKATVSASGAIRRCTDAEMLAMGLVRFKSRTDVLLPWSVLKRRARISTKSQRQLVSSARKQNADPMCWYGHIGKLSVAELSLERFDEFRGQWVVSSL